jgi:ubiquinone biosynthesis protein Coq4
MLRRVAQSPALVCGCDFNHDRLLGVEDSARRTSSDANRCSGDERSELMDSPTIRRIEAEIDETAPVPPEVSRLSRTLTEAEIRYMQGDVAPVASSILTSTSKYLNNPYYRDAFAQFGLRRFGNDLPETYLIPNMNRALAETRDDVEYYRLFEAEKKVRPELAAFCARRYEPSYRPDEMRHYAPGTLGATIRDFIELSGMDMQFQKRGLEPATDLEFVLKRRAHLHDIEHMVTGFGPSSLGEVALAIMNVTATAAYFSPRLAKYISEAGNFVVSTGLYRTSLHHPEMLPHYLEAIQLGIEAGRAIKLPLFLIDWDSHLDWPLEDIATDTGFRRGPGEAWDWSRAAARS